MESGQIGILLSSDCMSYVSVRGGGTALIDTFSSSERGVKPSVMLKRGIPGQTDCLYGDGHGWGWGGGWRLCHSWMGLDAVNGYM